MSADSDDGSRFSDRADDNRKRAKKDHDNHEMILLLTYDSRYAAQCVTTAAAFVVQMFAITPTAMRLFENHVTDPIPHDIVEKFSDLPDLNTMFGQFAVMQFIGGFSNFNSMFPFQATEDMFFDMDNKTGLSVRVTTLEDDIDVVDTTEDYTQDLPAKYYIKLNCGDLVYHALSDDDNDRKIFRNLSKLWFVGRIYVRDDLDDEWEPHFFGFHQIGKNYFGFGGEDGAQLIRIPHNMLEKVFFDPDGQEMLLKTIGKSWEHRILQLGEFDKSILYLPKAYLKPPNRGWTQYSLSEIRKLKTLAYRVGKYQEKFKKNERFMFQAILSTDAKIKTLDETEFEKARAEFSEN